MVYRGRFHKIQTCMFVYIFWQRRESFVNGGELDANQEGEGEEDKSYVSSRERER